MGAEHGMLTGTLFAFATALGFGLALILFAGIREQLALAKVPEAMKGTPIALLTAGGTRTCARSYIYIFSSGCKT